ncbi:unnamed protein product [Fusarium fujikuroi]|nr:unnamed protein product [Fusarium fujikuroi]
MLKILGREIYYEKRGGLSLDYILLQRNPSLQSHMPIKTAHLPTIRDVTPTGLTSIADHPPVAYVLERRVPRCTK